MLKKVKLKYEYGKLCFPIEGKDVDLLNMKFSNAHAYSVDEDEKAIALWAITRLYVVKKVYENSINKVLYYVMVFRVNKNTETFIADYYLQDF